MINLQTPGGTAEKPDDSFPMSAVFAMHFSKVDIKYPN